MRQTDETTMMLTTIANLASLALERHNRVLELADEMASVAGLSPTDAPATQACAETKDRLAMLQEMSENIKADPSPKVNACETQPALVGGIGLVGQVQAILPKEVKSSLKKEEAPKAVVKRGRKAKTEEVTTPAPAAETDADETDGFGSIPETNLEDILG